MAINVFELVGADDRRFSPYCWRTRFALAIKGLDAEFIPMQFTQKHLIEFSGQDRVPVLVDGETCVHDSWAIALYLDRAYADRPSIFGDVANVGILRFLNMWTDRVVMRGIMPMIIQDIFEHIDPADQAYFRQSREKTWGGRIEDIHKERDTRLVGFRKSLEPLRATLAEQPFLSGANAGYADCLVFSAFQWARIMSDFQLLETDDPIFAWRDKMLDQFGGLARSAPGYAF
ncbi:MAG: glutathione S-transferase N-terminal domain-containing protein [Rhodospirillales bacterium]|nr:glutathione S-transferase N-terminal domain-containing protein [Rhodospirillales bacterium]